MMSGKSHPSRGSRGRNRANRFRFDHHHLLSLYRTLLIVVVPILFVTAILHFSVSASFRTRDAMIETLKRHAVLQNLLIGEQLGSSLDSLNSFVMVIQEYSVLTEFSPGQTVELYNRILKKLILADDLAAAVSVFDSSGTRLFTAGRADEPRASLVSELLTVHRDQQLGYHVTFDDSGEQLVVSFSVLDRLGNLRFNAVMIDREQLFPDFEQIDTQDLVGIMLVDLDGRVVSQWDKRFAFDQADGPALPEEGYSARTAELVMTSDPQAISGALRHFEDDEVIITTSKLKAYPFSLGCVYSKRLHLQDWQRSQRWTMAMLAVLSTGMVAAAVLLRSRIWREETLRLRMYDELEALVDRRTAELREERSRLEAENRAHRRTAEVLREREEQYRSLFSNSPDAVFLNVGDRLVLVNQACLDLFGAESEAELLGKSVYEVFHPGAHALIRERIRYLREEGRSVPPHEEQVLRLDGTVVDVEVVAAPFRYGNQMGIHVIARDITTRKQSDMERERLQEAFRQTGEVMYITDSTGAIQYVNPAFERVTGYRGEEVRGRNSRLLKSGKQDREFYRTLWITISSGQVWSGRLVNRRKDGSFFTEEATISPVLSGDGQIVNYVAVMRDISRELVLEEQYRQSQKLESIGQLAGGIAHDFNNMLGVIIGYSELAMDLVEQESAIADSLREIRRAAERSANLTRQLLGFARRQAITPQNVQLNELIENLDAVIRSLIKDNVELRLKLSDGLLSVRIDPSQIEQVLINLLLNARDAVSGVGSITVETELIEVDEDFCREQLDAVPGRYIRMTVSDNGIGMDRATQQRIFDPFFTTKKPGQGTGLGLPMVYGAVRQNKGFVTVWSEPGKGTAVSICLPAIPAHEEAANRRGQELLAPEPKFTLEPGSGQRILLAEDDERLLGLAAAMLIRLGYQVDSVPLPSKALELVAAGLVKGMPYDLLITDVLMPEMNGRQLAEKTLSLSPGTRILYVSGYTAHVIEDQGIVEAGRNFIQKPFSQQQLANAVAAAFLAARPAAAGEGSTSGKVEGWKGKKNEM